MRYQSPPQSSLQCVYDLKAVCNHLGSALNQGHYTASCLNSTDSTWYSFDDRTVKSICQTEVVSADAYILFYQRRELSSRIPEKVLDAIENRKRQGIKL